MISNARLGCNIVSDPWQLVVICSTTTLNLTQLLNQGSKNVFNESTLCIKIVICNYAMDLEQVSWNPEVLTEK